jgi:hypothetical protein
MKINKLFIGILFIINLSNAQEFKLGKVSIAELEEKQHPTEPEAPAAILFEKGNVTFEYTQSDGFQMTTVVQAKIKIYKKEVYEWANKAVRYYIPSTMRESVSFDDAVTYNLVAGKIEKTKLKSDGEFDEKINKYWSRKKIAMPNVKEGSIIEYKYTIKSPNIVAMKDWSFQTSIPVNYSELKVYTPEYFVYKPNQRGYVFPKTTVEKKTSSITINSKERSGGQGFSGVSTTFNSDKIEYEETQTTYTCQNLPSMKEEAFVNNIDNYTSSISHELTMARFPNQPYKTYATDWETVTKKIYEDDDFGGELNKTGYFEEDINTLISGITTRDEKIATIFSFVKSKVKWNDYTGYGCDDGVKKAYKDGIGNIAEINLMLTAMLRFAQLDANPVLLSTRSNGIALFPSRAAFNYVIAGIETPEGIILLDAAEKFSTPNILPLRDINWLGRLIRKDGTSTEVDLTPKTLAKETANLAVTISGDGTISGKIRKQYTNHYALLFRDENIVLSKDTYQEKLEKKCHDIEISDYIRENDSEISKPIVETFSFKDPKGVEIINNKMYISPLFFLSTNENPFKQEVREYPVDFGFPKEDKFNINIDIPAGFVVETMPVAAALTTGEEIANFKYLITNTDEKIQISITSTINAPIVPADYYDVLKEYFQKIIDKQNEKIVLVKK